ncbi:MAG: flagellar hook capping FlgD N-terminal domain-containing protein [Planctomycetota bacterium]
MSISALTGTTENLYVSSSQENARSSSTQANKSLVDQDQFLQLLIAQLRYQDPLSPMDNQEFMTQLAQLQTLDQQIDMTQDLAAMRLESQIAYAAQLICTYVVGKNGLGFETEGVVLSAVIDQGTAYLNLNNGDRVALRDVTRVDQVILQDM